MFCPKCGEILRDNARRCPVCGVSLVNTKSMVNGGRRTPVDQLKIIRDFFVRFKDFSGRSSRAEFLWSYLFLILGTVALCSLSTVNQELFEALFMLWYLGTLVPLIALHIRRLHDVGKSGWWMLTSMIPVVGISLTVLLCMPSQRKANRWGPSPL